MINLSQKVFESIFHICYSAIFNHERGKQFFKEEEIKKEKIEYPS